MLPPQTQAPRRTLPTAAGELMRTRASSLLRAALLAGFLALTTHCSETQRSLGDPCLRNADCLSGYCAGQQCVSAPNVFDGAPPFDATAGDASDASDAGDAAAMMDARLPDASSSKDAKTPDASDAHVAPPDAAPDARHDAKVALDAPPG
jgi:hypothetical protein